MCVLALSTLGHAHLDRPLTSRNDSSSSVDFKKNERCVGGVGGVCSLDSK